VRLGDRPGRPPDRAPEGDGGAGAVVEVEAGRPVAAVLPGGGPPSTVRADGLAMGAARGTAARAQRPAGLAGLGRSRTDRLDLHDGCGPGHPGVPAGLVLSCRAGAGLPGYRGEHTRTREKTCPRSLLPMARSTSSSGTGCCTGWHTGVRTEAAAGSWGRRGWVPGT